MRKLLRYIPPLLLAINSALLVINYAAGTPPGVFTILAVVGCALYMTGVAAEMNGRG